MQVTPPGKRPFPTPPAPNAPDLESATFANRGTVVLPDEMVIKILMNLGTTDIAVYRSVNRHWQTLIDTHHLLARSFYRDCHLTQRNNSLAAQHNLAVERYHSHIRGWLADFGDRGRETARQLDNILKGKHFPEVLFFSIPKFLLNSNELTYQNTATIRHPGLVRGVSFSPEGKYLVVTASTDNTAKLSELEDGQWREKAILSHSARVTGAGFSPDGKLLLTASSDRICRIWRLEDDQWQEKATIQDSGPVRKASFSPDGKSLVIASGFGSAKIWGLVGGKWQEKFTIQGTRLARLALVTNAQFSPDGKYLGIASSDGTVKIWKLNDGQWEEKFTIHHRYRVIGVRFSPNGKHLVTVTSSEFTKNATLWELEGDQWQEKATIRHFDNVNNVHFSPDGKHFVTASREGAAKICGLEGGKWQVKTIIWHFGPVANASFSHDGKLLVTASGDGKAKICGLVGGKWQEIVTIEHSREVTDASFGPDYQLVTTCRDNTFKIWVLKNKENGDNSELVSGPLEKHTIKKK